MESKEQIEADAAYIKRMAGNVGIQAVRYMIGYAWTRYTIAATQRLDQATLDRLVRRKLSTQYARTILLVDENLKAMLGSTQRMPTLLELATAVDEAATKVLEEDA